MTYSVVHFFEDESVEAVPHIWVKKDYCAWPINKTQISKYIASKLQPNAKEFANLKARVLCKKLCKNIN
jgi:hypothetical protein